MNDTGMYTLAKRRKPLFIAYTASRIAKPKD